MEYILINENEFSKINLSFYLLFYKKLPLILLKKRVIIIRQTQIYEKE